MKSNKFKPKLIISTKRLCVRPYRYSDFNTWKKAFDERLPKQNEFDLNKTPEHLLKRKSFNGWLKDRLEMQKKDLVYIFGIFDKKTGEHFGTIDLKIIERLRIQSANLGYGIHNHQWKKGYATEASVAVIELAFRQLKLHRVEAAASLSNKASIGVAKSIGMKREGVRKRIIYLDEKWVDSVFYYITSEMWGVKKMKPSFFTKMTDYL